MRSAGSVLLPRGKVRSQFSSSCSHVRAFAGSRIREGGFEQA